MDAQREMNLPLATARDPSAASSVCKCLTQNLLLDLPAHRRHSYWSFSVCFMLIIAAHLMVNPVKYATFTGSVGKEKLPQAQTLVPLVLFPCLCVYNLLVSCVPDPRTFVLIITSFYASVYTTVFFLLQLDGKSYVAAYLLLFATDTKSVILPVMMWSVVNDVSTPALSKKAYPTITMACQLGGMLGSLLAASLEYVGGTVGLICIQVAMLLAIGMTSWLACSSAAKAADDERLARSASGLPANSIELAAQGTLERHGTAAPEQADASRCDINSALEQLKAVLEGLVLIGTKQYVFLTFWVSCAHLAIRMLMDYQGTALLVKYFDARDDLDDVQKGEGQVQVYALVGFLQTATSMMVAALGTRDITAKLGLQGALLGLPLAMLIGMLCICMFHNLWVVQISLIICNGITHGLNGPCREMLYVRTSKQIRYKAKSWADMYGNWLQKTLGNMVNTYWNSKQFDAGFSAIFSVVWAVTWMLNARTVGTMYMDLEAKDAIVS